MTVYDAKGVRVGNGRTSRRKGYTWALTCRRALERLGITVTARQGGEAGDDIVLGHPYDWLSVEAKCQDKLSLGAWVDQARRNAAPGQLPVVWVHRRGKADPLDGFVVIDARDYWRDITGRTL